MTQLDTVRSEGWERYYDDTVVPAGQPDLVDFALANGVQKIFNGLNLHSELGF